MGKGLRIGVDARVLYLPLLKGIGIYLYNLLLQLNKIDYKNEYILYFDTRQHDLVKHFPELKNFIHKGISIKRGDRFHCWEQLRLPAAIKEDKIDIFHSPANTTMFSSSCPVITTVHDATMQETAGDLRLYDKFYYALFQPRCLRKAKKIITPSQYSKDNLIRLMHLNKDKIEVIYNGLDEAFKAPQNTENNIENIKQKYGIQGSYILSVGGESPWKNVSNLIKGFASLVHQYDFQKKLVITGIRTDFIMKSHLGEIENLGINGKVRILEYVPQQELVNLYHGAELFVYPSLKEGFGFPPLEAMASGVPVIASDKTAIPEIVANAALLIDASNPKNIANAIKKTCDDAGLKKELISKGFQRSAQFSWQKTAEDTLRIYESFVK